MSDLDHVSIIRAFTEGLLSAKKNREADSKIEKPTAMQGRVLRKDVKKQLADLKQLDKSLKMKRAPKERNAEQIEKDKAKMKALRDRKKNKKEGSSSPKEAKKETVEKK